MKLVFLSLTAFLLNFTCTAQLFPDNRNIFIITIDGYRWQELFGGADPQLLNDPQYVRDTALNNSLFGDQTPEARRQKLMPFFWNVIASKGQLYGNRKLGNKSDVKNWFKISYPGYNEMLTGFPDPLFIPNIPLNNRNINVLEFLNGKDAYRGKVVAFTSWNIFPFILNEKRSRLPVNSGYRASQNMEQDNSDSMLNTVQDDVVNKSNTRYDELTFLHAKGYIEKHHPKIVFLGFGETDACAHSGRYDLYLQKANCIDRMIGELWYFIQTDPFYKNNTSFIITTDHGRGSKPSSWFTHGIFTKGSSNTWLALLGAGINPEGEIKNEGQLYQGQLAATIGLLAGIKFQPYYTSEAPIVSAAVREGSNVQNIQVVAK